MNSRRLLVTLCVAAVAASLGAGTPNYTYLRSIDLGAHPTASRMLSACAGPNGSIYFVDNGTDHVYCIPTPLTATGATNAVTDVPLVTSSASFNSGYSFNGIAWDGTNIYASGANGASSCQLWKISGTVGAWTATQVTGMPAAPYSGCAAVGTGRLVLSREDTLTNGFTFFTIAGTAATADGSLTRSGPLSPRHTVADMTNGKIYQAVASSSWTGGVQVFDTTAGTSVTTTYTAGSNPLVNTSASSLVITSTGLNYAQMTVDPEDQVIVVARNGGTAAASVWALYDVSAGGTNLVPYATINGAGGSFGALDSSQSALGAAFFTAGSDKYLALGRSDGGIQIYQKTVDATSPTLYARTPAAQATVASLPSVSVTFSENVTGVTAGQLTVNGSPATGVSGSGAGPYVFTGYAAPPDGLLVVVLAGGVIADPSGNAFEGESWNYTKNSALQAALPGPLVWLPFEDAYILEAFFDLVQGTTPIADWTGWTSSSWVSPNAYNNHGGTDFSLSTGTPEYAATTGTVIQVVTDQPENNHSTYYGNYVRIATGAASPLGDEVDVLVAHMLPNVAVTVGQTVVPGQLIGYSDNTGNSTSEHCHLQAMLHASETVQCPFYHALFKYPIMFNPNARVQVGHIVKVKTTTTPIRADRFDSSAQIGTAHRDQHYFACFAKRGYWRVHIPNDASNRSGWLRATDVEEVFEGTVIQALPDSGAYNHTGQLATPYAIRAASDAGSAIVGYIRYGGGRFVADQQAAGGWYRVSVPGPAAAWGWVQSDARMVVYPELYNPAVDLDWRPNSSFPLVNSFDTPGPMTWGRMKFDRGVVQSFSPASPGGDGNAFFLTDVVNYGDGTYESMSVGRPEHTNYYVQADVHCNYSPSYGTYERVGIFLRDDGFGGFDGTFEGAGNCYAMTWDTNNGRLRVGCMVDGVITDFFPTPQYYPSTAWRRMRIEAVGSNIRFYLDGMLLRQQTDTIFPSGLCGIGYSNHISGNPAARGCYYDNFIADEILTAAAADLSVTKTAPPGPAYVDAPLTDTVVVSNIGPDASTAATLVDTLPAGATFVSATATQGTCAESSGSVVCDLGPLGAVTPVTVTIVIMPQTPGQVTNVATVSGPEHDPNPDNNQASAGSTVLAFHPLEDDTFDTNNEEPGGSATGWSQIGVTLGDPALNTADYNAVLGAYRTRIYSNATRFHIIGWADNRLEWLPYTAIGSQRYVRAKFYMYAAPQDGESFTDPRQLPNFEMRLASRFAVTANLHVYHHNQLDEANNAFFQELRPGTDPDHPSVYRLDFDPIDVPFLSTSTSGEGIMTGYDVFTLDAHDHGYINMTERVIGTYPASLIQDSAALQTKIYGVSATDAGNLRIYNSATDLRTFNYVSPPIGSPAGTFSTTDVTGALGTHGESPMGVTLDTTAVATDRIGFIERSFFAGASDGSADYANRIRVAEDRQYKIRWHVTSTQTTTQQAWLWLMQRSVKYANQQSLQLAGGWGSNGPGNLAVIRQSVPGVGCLNPDKTGSEDGGWYTVLYNTPLDADIRPEFAAGTPVATRMPNIAAQPGPGVDASSLRDIKLAAQVYDSISQGAGAATEGANFTIDRIEVRVFDRVAD